jgi:hypothetical protein
MFNEQSSGLLGMTADPGLVSLLASMEPKQRQHYVAQHSNDINVVIMGKVVSDIANKLDIAKKGGQPGIKPTVLAQTIASMAPETQVQPQGPQQAMPQRMPPQGETQMAADGGYMDSRLPEDMGIGALPERSLSGMADGGIVGFAAGGNPKGKKLPSFDDALDAEGVRDPRQRAFLKALYGQESGSGADTTTSNQGAVGHMQIKPSTFKQVADKGMDINNPFDNMRAGIRYGMQGYQAANGDPVLAGAHYYGGPGGMEALAKGQVRTDSKNPKAPNTLEYGKSIAQRMTALLPIGSAQAQTAPAPTTEPAPAEQGAAFGIYPKSGARTVPVVTAEDKAAVAAADAARAAAVAQIPGGSGGTPAPAPVDTRTIFGKGADYLGVPEGFQREFSNTLNALGGYSSPVAAAKSMGAADELAATPEMIAKAAAAKRVAETPRLLPPVKAGIAALPQEAQTLRAEAEAARRARLLAEDQKAAVAAENSVNAANATSKIASEVEAANLAKQTAAAANAAKVAGAANVAKTGALAQGVAQGVATDTSSGYEREPYSTGEYRGKSGIADIDIGPKQPPLTPEVKKEAVAEATKTIMAGPEPDRLKGLGYEDLLMFGLQLMAGKSQYALQNVGEAGVAALTANQARRLADQKSKFAEREADREERKTTAAVKSADALSRKYGAEALALEADTKTDSAMRMKAAALAQQDLQDWAKLPANFTATPAQVNAKRSELMRTYFDLLGQASTMAATGSSLDLTQWGTPVKN